MSTVLRACLALAAAIAATIMVEGAAPWARDKVDFFLLVAVYYAISGSRIQAVIMGALAGLMQDVFASQYLGFHTFVKTGVAYLVSSLGSRFMLSQLVPQFLSLIMASFLDGVLTMLVSSLAGLPPQVFVGALMRTALLNGILGMPIFAAVRQGLPGRRRRR